MPKAGKGVLLGTPAYMSPEQARRQPADNRSDVWAFGCVLYELLSGKTLFKGNTLSDTIGAILEREPDFSALPPHLSPGIRRLLERCLAKKPKRRLHSIADVRLEIEEILANPQGTLAQPTPQGLRLLPYVATLAIAVVVAAVGGWYLRPSLPTEPRPVTRFEYELPEAQRPFDPMLAISPDGSQVVISGDDGLHLRSIGELETRPVAGTEGELIRAPFFSPDGQWIGYFSPNQGQLRKVPVGGGMPVLLTEAENALGLFWTSGNSILYGQANLIGESITGRIMRVSANGGPPEALVEREGPIFKPTMLPGEEYILFATINSDVDAQGDTRVDAQVDTRMVVRSLESGDEKVLFAGGPVYFVTAQAFRLPARQRHCGPSV